MAAQLPNATTFVSPFLPPIREEPWEELLRLLLCSLILCAVYTPLLLCACHLSNRCIERERAKYFDLC